MNNDILLAQSKLLKQITDNLCKKLPEGGIYNVSRNLQDCLGKLPEIIQEYENAEDRLIRIHKANQIQNILDECIEYLDFISLTRQFNSSHLLVEFNELLIQFRKKKISNLNSEEVRVDFLNLN